ncbi:MAG: type II toxin-antitoxin system RelE/ParE family toxin [Proteobacteria bacterium]|nr:type II toxin-antitoxin system RelE/ParE family toxin [Pseudomonadota bacterium]
MKTIQKTAAFEQWLINLRDKMGQFKIQARIDRVERDNFGDCESVGEGVSELRIHYGPGYRVYFMQQGQEIVILLAGGDKSSQSKDIQSAHEMARRIKENK